MKVTQYNLESGGQTADIISIQWYGPRDLARDFNVVYPVTIQGASPLHLKSNPQSVENNTNSKEIMRKLMVVLLDFCHSKGCFDNFCRILMYK